MAVRGVTTFENTSATLTLATGYTLGLAPGTDRVVMDIDGWHKPAPNRRRKTERQGSHGTFGERSYKDERLVSVTGSYRAPDRATAAAFVDDVAAFLAEGTSGVLTVADPDLGERYAKVFLDGTDVDWHGGVDVKFTVDLAAPNPRKYGGAVSSTTGPPVDGGALEYDLFTGGPYAVARTNLITNPSFQSGVPAKNGTMTPFWYTWGTGWDFSKLDRTRGLRLTASGVNELQYAYLFSNIPVTAGQYVNFAYNVSSGNAAVSKASLFFLDSGGASMASPRPSTGPSSSGRSVYLPETLTTGPVLVPEGAVGIKLPVYSLNPDGSNPLSSTLYLDKLIMITGPTPESVADVSYFDGATADTGSKDYAWTGTPDASTSTESVATSNPGVLSFGAPGSSGIAEVVNAGTADALSKFSVEGYAPGFTIKELETGRRLVYSGTVPAGSVLFIDPVAGVVELDGSDRGQLLTVREWTPVPARGASRYLFESAGPNARMTVEGVSAWW